MDAARTQSSDLANGNGLYVKSMLLQPMAVILNRGIIGDSNIGANCRHPGGQQPQVMTELAGKRRRGVIVLPMRQRQVMLRIEKINVNHHVQDNNIITINNKNI